MSNGNWVTDNIGKIFDDGSSDEQGKPKMKRSIGFVLAIGFLALVTGTFTYSYLQRAVENASIVEWLGVLKYIIPAAGLVAFDLGAIFWSVQWRNNSSNDAQDMIARALFVADIFGMSLTTLAHFVNKDQMPPLLYELTPFIVAMIIIGNVVGFFEYENRSDEARIAREYRKGHATLNRQQQTARLHLEREQISLANQITAAQRDIQNAQLRQQLEQLRLQSNAMRGGTELLNSDFNTIQTAKQEVHKGLRQKFSDWMTGNPTQSAEPQTVMAASVVPVVPMDDATQPLTDEERALLAKLLTKSQSPKV